MKRTPLAIRLMPLITLCLAPAVAKEERQWTSTDGRQVVGVFVGADPKGVTIRRDDGKEVTIPPDMLVGEDLLHASKLAEKAKQEAEKKALEERRKEHLKDLAEYLDGPLTYGLSDGSEKWPEDRKQWIVDAMDAAVAFLNKHGNFKKHVTANNSPGTPTADANFDGWINWGGTINRRVALHEIGHTLGIGTCGEWHANIKDGKWTGRHAIKQLREFDGRDAILYADRMHFWPYGLNYDSESSPEADVRFVKMVEAMRKDMGLR